MYHLNLKLKLARRISICQNTWTWSRNIHNSQSGSFIGWTSELLVAAAAWCHELCLCWCLCLYRSQLLLLSALLVPDPLDAHLDLQTWSCMCTANIKHDYWWSPYFISHLVWMYFTFYWIAKTSFSCCSDLLTLLASDGELQSESSGRWSKSLHTSWKVHVDKLLWAVHDTVAHIHHLQWLSFAERPLCSPSHLKEESPAHQVTASFSLYL